jgi:hypothetical protein
MLNVLRVVDNPNLRREWVKDLELGIADAALIAEIRLKDKLSPGNRSGRFYRWKYPRRSSRMGQYPQGQFGDLKKSVASVRVSSLEFEVGFYPPNDKVMKQALYLEFTGKAGQRRPLWKFFEGRDSRNTLREMRNAIILALA